MIATIATRASAIQLWWAEHRTTVLRVAVTTMGILAALKLGDEFARLIWRSGPIAAIDLEYRYAEVQTWFAGRPVYYKLRSAAYPPASYTMLWPLLGWVTFPQARWLWAVTAAVALGLTIVVIVRASGAATKLERSFVGLLLLSMNAAGVAIGNGQLTIQVLPALLIGILTLHQGRGGWRGDLLAAGLLLVSLVKLTLVIPLLWLALLAPRAPASSSSIPRAGRRAVRGWRVRPALLIAAGYVALTFVAAAFQERSAWSLVHQWLGVTTKVGVGKGGGAHVFGAYANLHTWLSDLGLASLILPAMAVTLLGLGVWLHKHRHADLWLLLGVSALFSRFWTYHRLYDDPLVLIALVALFRVTKYAPANGGRAVIAAILLGATVLVMLLPARLQVAAPPWPSLFNTAHGFVWLAVLVFLAHAAAHQRRGELQHSAGVLRTGG